MADFTLCRYFLPRGGFLHSGRNDNDVTFLRIRPLFLECFTLLRPLISQGFALPASRSGKLLYCAFGCRVYRNVRPPKNCQLSILENCQLSTVNCQLSTLTTHPFPAPCPRYCSHTYGPPSWVRLKAWRMPVQMRRSLAFRMGEVNRASFPGLVAHSKIRARSSAG